MPTKQRRMQQHRDVVAAHPEFQKVLKVHQHLLSLVQVHLCLVMRLRASPHLQAFHSVGDLSEGLREMLIAIGEYLVGRSLHAVMLFFRRKDCVFDDHKGRRMRREDFPLFPL